MQQKTHSPNRHVLVFDHPRSCSNLLGKLLDTHPDVTRFHRPWREARTRGPDRPGLSVTQETMERFQKRREGVEQRDFSEVTVVKANERVAESIRAAREKDNLAIIQEHTAVLVTDETIHHTLSDPSWLPSPSANTTIMPSAILKTSIPILLIRHPALAIPSFLRMHLLEEMLVPEDDMFRYWISLRWLRIVFEHLEALARGPEPILVIDAYDLVYNTEAVMSRLCGLFQIRSDGVRETWNPGEGVVEPSELDVRWVETLRESSGVIRSGKRADEEICVDDLVEGWEREFGADRGRVLKGMVEGEMGDYRFLWDRRVRF